MLETLFDVQERDLEIDAIEAKKQETPQELLDTRAKVEDLERRLQERQRVYDDLRKQVRSLELELETLQMRRKSAANSALTASSSKEASQFQNQELQFATRIEELEGDTLPLMEKSEQVKAEVDALEAELAETRPKFEQLVADEEARIASLDAEMGALLTRRNSLAADIEAGILRQYEQIRKARRGVGLATVEDGQRCSGCNVRLPLHVLQKVKRAGDVTRCPSCGRLLFMK
jgi:predicted  nucleic acid-binding Zn-ribbon protein